jgi:molybdopterin-guanine dinucleotide biosynthesis protein A
MMPETDSSAFYGLLLVGGKSKRMGFDKSRIAYHGKPQWQHGTELLSRFCSKVFLSVRATEGWENVGFPLLKDRFTEVGPLGGILTALAQFPNMPWIVLACDLPFMNENTLRFLVEKRNFEKIATVFQSHFDALPEPLCAIYEPRSYGYLKNALDAKKYCPRAALIRSEIELLPPMQDRSLDNINTQEEWEETLQSLNPLKKVRIEYYALLKEERGCDREEWVTKSISLQELYQELQKKYHFSLNIPMLRVAVNDTFCEWSQELKEGDSVVFIPPVSGG